MESSRLLLHVGIEKIFNRRRIELALVWVYIIYCTVVLRGKKCIEEEEGKKKKWIFGYLSPPLHDTSDLDDTLHILIDVS